jgi:hypothetical protein
MPFQSEKQRRFLHANHPEIAKRWEKEYSHGGILDINESEEIISDDGNDIELTDYNAAFDDPNDLSTGVKSLFRAKDGGRIGFFTGMREAEQKAQQDTGGGKGGGADVMPVSPVAHPTGDASLAEQIAAADRLQKQQLKNVVETGPGSPIEKYDTQEQHLADIPGDLEGPPHRINSHKTRVNLNYKNDNYEQALANQKAKLKSMGLTKLIPLFAMIAFGVPPMDALKAFPKTISITQDDLRSLITHSLPVVKAKKELIEALGLHKGALVKDVDITNPNEMVNLEETTDFTDTMDRLTELTTIKDEDPGDKGPELPPQLGGPSTEEMATEYVETDWLGAIREKQAQKKAYDEKIERERLAREENPIVSGTERDIIMIGNRGGLANLFRVKNQ